MAVLPNVIKLNSKTKHHKIARFAAYVMLNKYFFMIFLYLTLIKTHAKCKISLWEFRIQNPEFRRKQSIKLNILTSDYCLLTS
jgi:hypothetical protein